MPGGDGDLACKEIKSDFKLKSTPVIIVTSSNYPQDIERCNLAGCDGFIQKPMTREHVFEAIKKFIKLPEWSGKRTVVNLPAKYGASPDKPWSGVVTDISIGGVFLEAAKSLEINTTIHLEFRLNHQNLAPIQCQGRVARISYNTRLSPEGSTGMGIEFTDIKTLDLLTIQSWLAKPQ